MKNKKIKIFITLIFVLALENYPQPRLLDLQGIEDSISNTSLFFREIENSILGGYCFYRNIYSLNLSSLEIQRFIWDADCSDDITWSHNICYDYVFYDYMKKNLYCGEHDDYGNNKYSFIVNVNNNKVMFPYNYKIKNLEISRLNNNKIFASVINSNNYGILKSSDGGYTWDDLSAGLYFLRSVSQLNDSIFLSSSAGKLYKSTNSGVDYKLVDENSLINWNIEFYDNCTYCGHFKFLYDNDNQHIYTVANNTVRDKYYFLVSTDGGDSWQIKDSSIATTPIYIDIDQSSSGAVYKCIDKIVYQSTDYSETFTVFNEILADNNIRGIYKKPSSDKVYIINTYELYEVTAQSVTRILSLTDIEDKQNDIPKNYQISNNYPNPFNPSTKINYQLPKTGNVTLKVFDILGREVATLVNEKKLAGSYQVEFNASNLPSGVYFYRLIASDPYTGSGQSFVETKKMLLIK